MLNQYEIHTPSVHWITTYFSRLKGPIPSNLSGSENCTDGIDNDNDSQIDCDDSDCDESQECSHSYWQMHLAMARQETSEWESIYDSMCKVNVNLAIRKAINGTYTVTLNQQPITISAADTESPSDIAQRLANEISTQTNFPAFSTGPYILVASHTLGESQLNSFASASDPTAIEHKRACEGDIKILNTFDLTFSRGDLISVDGQSPDSYSSFIIPVENLLTGASDIPLELHMDTVKEGSTFNIEAIANGQGICTKTNTCLADDWTGSQCEPDHSTCQAIFNDNIMRYATTHQTEFQNKSDWATISTNQYFENLLSAPPGKPTATAPAHCTRPVDIIENVDSTDQVMIVLDRSGSMNQKYEGESRLDFARAAIHVFLSVYKNVKYSLKVGVVEFNHAAQQIWPVNNQTLQALTPGSFNDIITALNNIQATGSTSIGGALLATAPAFASLPRGPRTILLVSDGYNNQPPNPITTASNLRNNLGIRIFSVAATKQADEETMSDLAGQSDGATFNSEKPSELLPAYFEMAAKIRGYDLVVRPTGFSVHGLKATNPQYPEEKTFQIPVEQGAEALRVLISADMAPNAWGLNFELIGPSGQLVLDQSNPDVQSEDEFSLVKVDNPAPGIWQLVISAAKYYAAQHSYFAAYLENHKPDCRVSAIYSPNPDKLEIIVEPSWVHPLAVEALNPSHGFDVEILTPDSNVITLTTTWDSLSQTHSVTFNDLSIRGRYKIAAKCDIARGTPVRDGESIFDNPDLNLESPAFVRIGTDSFFWDSKELYCPGVIGDCDGDGIPDNIEALYNKYGDNDDLPNEADFDSDNDDLPDWREGSGDCDNDGIPNFVDLDSDNDGTPDGQDNCPCDPLVHFLCPAN